MRREWKRLGGDGGGVIVDRKVIEDMEARRKG